VQYVNGKNGSLRLTASLENCRNVVPEHVPQIKLAGTHADVSETTQAAFGLRDLSGIEKRETTNDYQSRNGRNYVKRMVNEYQSAAEVIAEVPARYI
jgi:hypothetical protein